MSSLYTYQLLQRIPFGSFLVPLLPNKLMRHEIKAISDLNKLMLGYVDDFLANNHDGTEILQKLVNATDPLTGARFDRETLMGESRGLVVAGVETTAAALTYATYELAKEPKWFQTLAEELRNAAPDLNSFVDNVDEAIPEERLIARLPFLSALLKEVFRCYPAGVRPFPRTVPPEGTQLDGYFLPGGTEVTCSSWVQGRWDKSLWSNDPEVFRPERWLEASSIDASDGKQSTRKRYSEMTAAITTFSSGPRGCIGRNLATLVLHLTTFALFRCLQPGVLENDLQTDTSKKETILTNAEEMSFIGTFVGTPKGHRLELIWARNKF